MSKFNRFGRFTITLALAFALLGTSACGSMGSSRRGPGVSERMPARASSKAVAKAEACDDGDMRSCNWVGIWFLVGGAGKQRRVEGVRYLKYACDEGYAPSCKLITAIKRKLRQRRG